MFDFKDIPPRPPRSPSLLSGLNYSAILDKSFIGLMIFLLLLMGLFLVAMIFTADKDLRLPFIKMEKAGGMVIEIVDNTKCNKSSVAIHYQFTTESKRTYYGDYVACRDDLYSSLSIGDSIPIVYDPGDPSFNGIEGVMGRNNPPLFMILLLPLFFMLLFIPMFLPNIKQVIVARSIFKKGLITSGEILFIGRKKHAAYYNFKGLGGLEVFYRFQIRSGETIECKVTMDNDWLANKLDIGHPVTVCYIEGKPERSFILDFFYR